MFSEKVYDLLKEIPFGKVTTYREIAEALGCRSYRAVGRILNGNKDLENVPCFKVVRSDGKIGGFVLGKEEKISRLKKEGIDVVGDRISNFKEVLFHFE